VPASRVTLGIGWRSATRDRSRMRIRVLIRQAHFHTGSLRYPKYGRIRKGTADRLLRQRTVYPPSSSAASARLRAKESATSMTMIASTQPLSVFSWTASPRRFVAKAQRSKFPTAAVDGAARTLRLQGEIRNGRQRYRQMSLLGYAAGSWKVTGHPKRNIRSDQRLIMVIRSLDMYDSTTTHQFGLLPSGRQELSGWRGGRYCVPAPWRLWCR
jgi:hypothetical protein